jgi:hypothetical protein
MMVQPESGAQKGIEFRFLQFDSPEEAEKALNEAVADGWQLVSYQAAGGVASITHFLVLSRMKQPEGRHFGF